jgi:hypothetical protein
MYKTLVYSPEAEIHIEGTNVSNDVLSGNISLVIDGISSLSFSLSNKGLRYSNLFKRMDRVYVKMKRIGPWIPVFTGYLDTVPGLQLYPGTVQFKASCTLKLLKYTYWDPGLPESLKLLNQSSIPWGNYPRPGTSTGNVGLDAAADAAGGGLTSLTGMIATGAAAAGAATPLGPIGGIIGGMVGNIVGGVVSNVGDQIINNVANNIADGLDGEQDTGDFGLVASMSDTSDSGLGQMLKNVITKVGGWDEESVKVQAFPQSFLTWVQENMPDDIGGVRENSLEMFREMFSFYDLIGEGGGGVTAGGGGLGDAVFTDIGPPANGTAYSDDELAWIALNAGWTGDDAAIAVAIMKAESGGKPGINNAGMNGDGTVDHGLWQINDVHNSKLPGMNRYDPAINTQLARMVYQDAGGWTPWSVYNNGLYQQHMPDAKAAVARGGTAPSNSGTKQAAAGKSGGGGGPAGTGGLTSILGVGPGPTTGGIAKSNLDPNMPDTSGMRINDSIEAVVNYKFPQTFPAQGGGWGAWSKDRFTDNGYHSKAQACDFSNGGDAGTPEMLALAKWWFENYFGKGLLELIYAHFNHNVGDDTDVGDGMGSYYGPGTMAEHRNHVHIAMAGVVSADGTTSSPSVAGGGAAGGGGGKPNILGQNLFTYMFAPAAFIQENSFNLTGKYASINDEPIMNTVQALCTASLRSFRSAPDGKFTAFYPDYFGLDGTAPALVLEDIEMKDVRIDINDAALATHVFTMGSENVVSSIPDELGYMRSPGVVTIEDEWLFRRATAGSYFPPETQDPMEFMQRYGIRPYKRAFKEIYSPGNEAAMLVLAIKEFMDRWARQYQTRIELTFMPELFPGMRVELSGHNLVVYVQAVNHSFSYDSGFSTTAEVMAPMRTGVTDEINKVGPNERDKVKGTPQGESKANVPPLPESNFWDQYLNGLAPR